MLLLCILVKKENTDRVLRLREEIHIFKKIKTGKKLEMHAQACLQGRSSFLNSHVHVKQILINTFMYNITNNVTR